MPLYVDQVASALTSRLAAFQNDHQAVQKHLQQMHTALTQLDALSHTDLEALIGAVDRPGARPTAEQDTAPLVLRFANGWSHHGEARDWAAGVLNGVTTCAVDGSQIASSRDLSIPVGLVQIGWFVNPHDGGAPYQKAVQVEVLTPEELVLEQGGIDDGEIEWRRWSGEMHCAMAFMREHAGERALAFIDGPLIVSFVGKLSPVRQKRYITLVEELLACSAETRVPVVGYTDSSYASDLTALLLRLSGQVGRPQVSDAALLNNRMEWGDRCRLYLCSRDDGIPNTSYYEHVLFAYLKTTSDHPPSRVDLPRWVMDAGLHDWVFDVIRAECVVGVGYPYPLETADAVAVLSSQDRERFYQLLQQFAQTNALPLRFSRKSMSKRSRR
jgi:hypothetical protein